MKLKLTLGIAASVLAVGGMAAEARPLPPHHHHARPVTARIESHQRNWRDMARSRFHHRSGHAIVRLVAPASGELRGLVERTAAENGVPYSLANAVVTIESRYNPHVSNGGALGLMQIKPQTARGLGFTGSPASLFDPDVNVRYGMAYLAMAYRQSGGDVCATVMRYQSGIGATHMSAANRAYCTRAHELMARA